VDPTPTPSRLRYSPRSANKHGHGGSPFPQNLGTPDRNSNSGHVSRSPPPASRTFPSPADHRQPPPPQLQSPPQQQPPSIHEHHRPAPPNHSLSASRSVDSAAEKGSNSKLPHGLTVHELKEMTKARLAAERGVGPVPSTVQVLSDPSMYQQHSQARSPYPDASADAWETASVSTAASDYPASLNGTASFNGDEAIPFARSSSYPTTNNNAMNSDWSDHYHPPADVSYAPNRRRAATLSPRPGLVHLHEHRPVLPPPSMPTDYSLQRQQQSFPLPPNKSAFGPPPNRYADVGNRVRTDSAVSLPSMSHTAEEFGGPIQPVRFSSQFDSVREDSAVTGLSDVFRGSQDDLCGSGTLQGFGSTTNSSMGLGSSSVGSFGGDHALRMRAATSTTSSSDFMGSSDLEDPRHRAATWSNPSSALDMFCGQDLSEDLASILKLSGAEQPKDDP